MKVVDAMSKRVDFVNADTTVKEVCRLIFGHGINGVPVCKDKKVIGFITERDILSKFYPSMQEYMEDAIHISDFEAMEQGVLEIFSLTADKIMSKNPTTVTPDTPLLQAQSLMSVRKVGRLPVVDKNGYLIGLISKGDIFRAAVGDKLPLAKEEEYHDWLSKHYDLVVDWGERLGKEIPDLTRLFRKEKVKEIMDIGCGTGEHDIALAKNGFKVLGLENSVLMHTSSKEKIQKLSDEVSNNLEFLNGKYIELLKKQSHKFDAAIFMGSAFPHIADDYKEVLSAVSDALLPKNSLIVFQIINFEKVFKVKNRFLDFNISKSIYTPQHEHAFLEFYDPPRKKGDLLTLNMAVLDFDGRK